MKLSTQPYKGARDFYPEDKRIQNYMFNTIRRVCELYGYEEYDAPILEPLELYAAKSGEEIVNEQTYTFEDRGGRQVAIRPEMTPTVSRMVAARRQELVYPLRWYSLPVNWRYERPQRGRLREFWQLNVDVFGIDSVEAELETIQLANDVLKEFGASSDMYEIRLNSRKLINYIISSYLKLDEQAGHDLMKLIDRMNKLEPKAFESQLKEIVGDQSKKVSELLQTKRINELPDELKDLASVSNLESLIHKLDELGIPNAVFDMSLMRGFDYYTDVVFEVFDTNPANNRSMFGGGRYDGLVGLFGVEPVATVGFGMGDVTLQNFLDTNKLLPELQPAVDAVVILLDDPNSAATQRLLGEIRGAGVRVAVDYTARKIDKQIKSAVKSGVKYAIFIGEQELETGKLKLKQLSTGEESQLNVDQIAAKLRVRI